MLGTVHFVDNQKSVRLQISFYLRNACSTIFFFSLAVRWGDDATANEKQVIDTNKKASPNQGLEGRTKSSIAK